ncbi:MAG TPA: sulfotransferase domain-containing protein [Candidatus Solibacter sp.]|nr:sulfotransferase domain-containing protein [Candidatus Solibacter sp.]
MRRFGYSTEDHPTLPCGTIEGVITIVSGLPRSGTSLMMQMLAAGGMPILTDSERQADIDNPRGYHEWEPIKQLPADPDRIDQAEGKAVKVITQLLLSLPRGRDYKVIFMERPLPEVLASQDEMLKRRGPIQAVDRESLAAAFRDHMKEVAGWLEEREEIPVCRVGYRKLLSDPLCWATTVRDFLGLELNVDAMASQVDLSLYRNRRL